MSMAAQHIVRMDMFSMGQKSLHHAAVVWVWLLYGLSMVSLCSATVHYDGRVILILLHRTSTLKIPMPYFVALYTCSSIYLTELCLLRTLYKLSLQNGGV